MCGREAVMSPAVPAASAERIGAEYVGFIFMFCMVYSVGLHTLWLWGLAWWFVVDFFGLWCVCGCLILQFIHCVSCSLCQTLCQTLGIWWWKTRHGVCPHRASSLMYSVTLYTCDYRLRSVLCRRSAGAVRWEEASSQRHFLEEVRLDGDVKGVCVFDLRY